MNSNQSPFLLGDIIKPNMIVQKYTISLTNDIDETYIFFKNLFYNTFEWINDGKIILKYEKQYTIINYYDKINTIIVY